MSYPARAEGLVNMISMPFKFQAISFSISTQFSSIWPIDMTILGATTELTCERWQWRSTLHSPKLQHYCNFTIRLFCVISSTLISSTLIGGVLSLCREAVGVFYTPSRLGHRSLFVGGSYLSAEVHSVYSAASANWQEAIWQHLNNK